MESFKATPSTTKFMALLIAMIAIGLLLNSSYAIAAELADVRVGQKPDKTRIVFDIKQNHQFKITKLNNPSRVVIDFYKTENQLTFKNKHFNDSRLQRMRVEDSKDKLSVILDLHKNFDYNYFTLGKNSAGAERLVVDLMQVVNHNSVPNLAANQAVKPAVVPVSVKPNAAVTQRSQAKARVTTEVHANPVTQSILNQDSAVLIDQGLFVVAIDPGHGGKDVGAVGHGSSYGNEVTLRI